MCRDKVEVQQSTWFTYFFARSEIWPKRFGDSRVDFWWHDSPPNSRLHFEPHDALGRAFTVPDPPVSFPLHWRGQKVRKTGSESCLDTVVTFSGAYRWTLVETPLENERFVAMLRVSCRQTLGSIVVTIYGAGWPNEYLSMRTVGGILYMSALSGISFSSASLA